MEQLLIYIILKIEDNESLEMMTPKRLSVLCLATLENVRLLVENAKDF